MCDTQKVVHKIRKIFWKKLQCLELRTELQSQFLIKLNLHQKGIKTQRSHSCFYAAEADTGQPETLNRRYNLVMYILRFQPRRRKQKRGVSIWREKCDDVHWQVRVKPVNNYDLSVCRCSIEYWPHHLGTAPPSFRFPGRVVHVGWRNPNTFERVGLRTEHPLVSWAQWFPLN